jgi:polar amino acid transport system permease protein
VVGQHDDPIHTGRFNDTRILTDMPRRPHFAVPTGRPSLARIVSVAVILAAVAIVVSVVSAPAMKWDIVRDNLFARIVLAGIRTTIEITLISIVLGALIGTALAVLMTSPDRLSRGIAKTYVWFFRGVPLLVQLIFWFNLATIFPRIRLSTPFTSSVVFDSSTNKLITPIFAAVLAFALHEAAFMAEIIRAGFQAVAVGEVEAAQSLGFTRWQVFRKIRLPQAMGVIIPPTGNQVITVLKTTALVSVISVKDLLYSVQIVYSRTFQVIPLLLVATIWYLVVVSVMTLVQRQVERYFNKWRRPISRRVGKQNRALAFLKPQLVVGR